MRDVEDARRERELGPRETRVAPAAYQPGVATSTPILATGEDAETALHDKKPLRRDAALRSP